MQTQNLPTHPMIFLSCPIEFVPTDDGGKNDCQNVSFHFIRDFMGACRAA